MKCNKAEKEILLQDADGATGNREAVLAAHLKQCGKCRTFQQLVTESKLAFGVMEEPKEATIHNILRQARLNAPRRKPVKIFGLKPVWAMAASVMIGLGFFFSGIGPGKVGMELDVTDAQMMECEDQFITVMYSGLSEDDLAFNFLMTFEES